VALGSGQHAHNPLLQELPDPITKLTWDNAALLAPSLAKKLQVSDGQLLRLRAQGKEITLPALLVPGQHPQVVGVALGYGRSTTARFANLGPRWLQAGSSVGPSGLVGVRVVPLAARREGLLSFQVPQVEVVPTQERVPLARTQDYHRQEVPEALRPPVQGERELVREISLSALSHPPQPAKPLANLWPEDFPTRGHRWAMVVDLAACTGCAACVVACQVENNVPVVGKDEVARHREMHWLRVDRYFLGEGEDLRVAHQPMFCQQCGHAPCETVCPVLATVHSEEGLNQQVYNRCVGTRYCANNCPYKVRRFNWFTYEPPDPLAAAAYNPDVTVRSRGVMEKCTFCVQRIEEARIEAQSQGQPFTGQKVRTACQDSCPAQAIVFGDLNDPQGPLAQAWASPRRYRVLEELGVEPSVGYLMLVRQEEKHG
jgi:molybdopterin-containing oxidoreductase family iron-sulfur binding subunit